MSNSIRQRYAPPHAQPSSSDDGERLKGEALDLLAQRRQVYVRRGQRALVVALLERGHATADDVRSVVDLPADLDPKLFGAVPKALVAAGVIAAAGYGKTTRSTAHARHLTVWRLVDAALAESWLLDHPDDLDQVEGHEGPITQLALFGAGNE